MVDKICEIKNQLIDKVERDISEYGLDRLDPQNLGETVDMIKDLAEAEEKCWKATYYREVTEAMEAGKEHEPEQMRTMQHHSARRTYADAAMRPSGSEELNALLEKVRATDPQERERLKNEVFSRLSAM